MQKLQAENYLHRLNYLLSLSRNRDHTRFNPNRVWCSGNIADSQHRVSQQPGVRLPVSEVLFYPIIFDVPSVLCCCGPFFNLFHLGLDPNGPHTTQPC